MKKQLRNLVISFCVVALLVVGIVVWVYVVTPKLGTSAGSSSQETSSAASIVVYKKNSSDISQLHIKNAKGEFTISQQKGKYSLDGMPTALLSQDSLSSDVTSAADIEATRLIESNAKDWAKYGLANPKAVLDITSKSGTVTVDIGNDTPTSSGTYVSVKGSGKIYLASSTVGSSFTGSKNDFVNLSVYAVDSSDLTKLTRIEFGGPGRKEPIVLDETADSKKTTSSGSTPEYVMSSPSNYPVNDDTITTFTSDLESVSADSVLSMDVSEKSLQKYGLVNPKYTVSLTYNNKTTKLLFGKGFTDSGSSYLPVIAEGTPVIYKVDASYVPFYDYQISNLASTLLFIPNIGDIKSVQAITAGKTYTLDMKGSSDKISGTVNGKAVKESNIKNFYESAIGITTEGLFQQAVTGKPYAKLIYTYRDAKKAPVTIDFDQIDSRKCTFTINGRTDFYVLRATVDTALTNMETLAAGKTVSGS